MPGRYSPGRARRFKAWYVQQRRRKRAESGIVPGDFSPGDWNSDDFFVGSGTPTPPVEYMTRLNGVNSFIKMPDILVLAGQPIKLNFFANSLLATRQRLLDNSGGVIQTPFIDVDTDGTITFASTPYPLGTEVLLDGVPVVKGVTLFPSDDQFHEIIATPAVDVEVSYIGVLSTEGIFFSNMSPSGFTIGDGSAHDYPLNEPWSADTPRIAYNTGSGADAEYINTVESDVEVRP